MPPGGTLPPLQGERGYTPPEETTTTYDSYTFEVPCCPVSVTKKDGHISMEISGLDLFIPVSPYLQLGYDTKAKSVTFGAGIVAGTPTVGLGESVVEANVRVGITGSVNVQDRKVTSLGVTAAASVQAGAVGVTVSETNDAILGPREETIVRVGRKKTRSVTQW